MGNSADPRTVESRTRPDGLVIARQAAPPGSASFVASFLAPAGWAYDPDGGAGTALVAGLVAPSAAGRRSRVELARLLDSLGATFARQVAPETVEYTIAGPAAARAVLLRVLADVALRPRFDPEDVARVKRQAIERQLRERSQPSSRADRALLEAMFPAGHPYRGTGVGTRPSVTRIRPGDLRRFHRAHTSSLGSYVVVTGGSSVESVVGEVRAAFGSFPSERPSALPKVPPLPALTDRTVRLPMDRRPQVEIRVGSRAMARADPRYDAGFLGNEVLGGGLLSRLFQNVRERQGLAYHASSELEAMRWGGTWVAGAGTGPERIGPALRAVLREVDRIRHDLVPLSELDRIRRSVIGEIPLAFETAASAHEIAVDVTYHGLGPRFVHEWPDRLRAVRPATVRSAAAEALAPAGLVTVLAGGMMAPRSREAPAGRTHTNTHK